MKDIKYYQDLTFEVLDKLIKEQCKRGQSRLYLTNYYLGTEMKQYLENKGFFVYTSVCSEYKYIEW